MLYKHERNQPSNIRLQRAIISHFPKNVADGWMDILNNRVALLIKRIEKIER